MTEPIGTVIVQFEDGSGLVVGDGSEDELREMVKLFGTIDPATLDIIKTLRQEGVALKAHVEAGPRTASGSQFEMVAETVADMRGL